MLWWVRLKKDNEEAASVVLGKKEEVQVEAEDRWTAVVEAAKVWDISSSIKMQDIFNNTSVGKVERKKVREFRTW